MAVQTEISCLFYTKVNSICLNFRLSHPETKT